MAPYFYDWLRHPDNDAYWQQWSIRQRYEEINVPALNFEGWYDLFIDGALENFKGMRTRGGSKAAREGQQLVVGPWLHLPWGRQVGQLNFGPEADNPIDALQLLDAYRAGDPTRPLSRVANASDAHSTWEDLRVHDPRLANEQPVQGGPQRVSAAWTNRVGWVA